MTHDARTCLSWWFPRLEATGVPVPRTLITRTESYLISLLDGQKPAGFDELVAQLRLSAIEVGLPCFLRTGMGSDKHGWKDSCYVTDLVQIPRRVARLVEWSLIVDMAGLPFDVWVVREFLPIEPAFQAFRGDMPVNRERRYFFSEGRVVSRVSYWENEDAFVNHRKPDGWRTMLAEVNRQTDEEVAELTQLTLRVAEAFRGEGGWALDWLWTKRGWYATDMAEAYRAWGCPKELES